MSPTGPVLLRRRAWRAMLAALAVVVCAGGGAVADPAPRPEGPPSVAPAKVNGCPLSVGRMKLHTWVERDRDSLVIRFASTNRDLGRCLESFKARGARYVAFDLPPGDGVRVSGTGIDAVIADVQRHLDGWDDICTHCGLRPMECRCEARSGP